MKALIISYAFTPNREVGGRRWTKFSTYLLKKNIDFKVITFAQKTNGNNQGKLEKLEQNIIRLKSKYPKVLGTNPKSIYAKLSYRINLFLYKLKAKGNYYDKTATDKKTFLTAVKNELDSNTYTHLIVSVAPFKLAFYLTEIKDAYPNVEFIVDFRDPWVTNRTSYGIESMNHSRFQYEVQAEEIVIDKFDKIITVANQISKDLMKSEKQKSKFYVLPNGFDTDEIENQILSRPNTQKLQLIFAGTFYNNSIIVTQNLESLLKTLKKDFPEMYNALSFEFYGSKSNYIDELSKKYDIIQNNKPLPIAEIHEKINLSTAGLLFLSDDITYSLSTKFCEYVAFKKPIVVFSKWGDTARYIEDNRIGYWVDANNMLPGIKKLYNEWKNESLSFNPSFNINQFDINHLTEKLLEIMRES